MPSDVAVSSLGTANPGERQRQDRVRGSSGEHRAPLVRQARQDLSEDCCPARTDPDAESVGADLRRYGQPALGTERSMEGLQTGPRPEHASLRWQRHTRLTRRLPLWQASMGRCWWAPDPRGPLRLLYGKWLLLIGSIVSCLAVRAAADRPVAARAAMYGAGRPLFRAPGKGPERCPGIEGRPRNGGTGERRQGISRRRCRKQAYFPPIFPKRAWSSVHQGAPAGRKHLGPSRRAGR